MKRSHVGGNQCVDADSSHNDGSPHHLHDGPILEQELADDHFEFGDATFLEQEPEDNSREKSESEFRR